MEQQAHKQYIRDLQRTAGSSRPAQKATLASLAAMKIAVETLPPPE